MSKLITKLTIVTMIVAVLLGVILHVTHIKYRYTVRENITYTADSVEFDLYCYTEYRYIKTKAYLDTFKLRVSSPETMQQVNLKNTCKKTSNLYE